MAIDTAPAAALAPVFTHQQITRVMMGIALCILLSALDQTIVVPAIPAMSRDLLGFGHLSWIVAAYLLTSTAATPIIGKLSDIYGRRGLLLLSIAAFTATSILCGLARSLPEMTLYRALQGIGGGGLLAMSHATIADVASPRERGRYQLYLSGTWGVASIVGPLAGGFLTDHLSWRYIFWINLPLGLLALLLTGRALAILPPRARVKAKIDYAGAALLTSTVGAILILLSWGGDEYAWDSPVIFGLGAGALSLLFLLSFQERRVASDPLLPPRLFRNSVATCGFALSFCNALCMLGTTFLLPLYFQFLGHADASSSGFLLMPFLLAFVVVSYAGGKLGRRFGRTKWLMVAAGALTAVGLALLGTVGADATPALTMLYAVVTGSGIGLIQPCVTTTVQNAVATRDLGIATSGTLLFRTMGGAFGATLASVILTWRFNAVLRAEGTVAHATLSMMRKGAAGGLAGAPRAALEKAMENAFHAAFLGCALVAAASVAIAVLTPDIPLRTTTDG
jgi:EmrB/QacA subfamily drug resistance transporter